MWKLAFWVFCASGWNVFMEKPRQDDNITFYSQMLQSKLLSGSAVTRGEMTSANIRGTATTRLKQRWAAPNQFSPLALRLVETLTTIFFMWRVCVCQNTFPHLLRVCGGGDGGGAGAAGHPVVPPFAIWLLVGAQWVHVALAAEHKAQSLQRLRRRYTHTRFKKNTYSPFTYISSENWKSNRFPQQLVNSAQTGNESHFRHLWLWRSRPWARHSVTQQLLQRGL